MKRKGMTMVEILIGATILTMVLYGIYSLFTSVGKTGQGLTAHSHIQLMAQKIMKSFKKDISNALAAPSVMTQNKITLNVAGHAGVTETVTWEIVSVGSTKNKLVRKVTSPKTSSDDFGSTGFVEGIELKQCADYPDLFVVDFGINLKKDSARFGFFRRVFSKLINESAVF